MKPDISKIKQKKDAMLAVFSSANENYDFKKIFIDDILKYYREVGNDNFNEIITSENLNEFSELYKKAYENNIFGLISKNEARALWFMASKLPQGSNIVEIGTFLGFSTIFLSQNDHNIFAIDNKYDHFPNDYEIAFFIGFYHDGDNVWERVPRDILKGEICDNNWKVMGCKNIVKINKFSTEAKNDVPYNLAMAFIDGDHGYQPCWDDIDVYYPRVSKGGIIAFHDFNRKTDGVTLAVHEFYEKYHDELTDPYISDSIIWFWRK